MAVAEDKREKKQVSEDSVAKMSGDAITRLEIQEECAPIGTSKGDDVAMKVPRESSVDAPSENSSTWTDKLVNKITYKKAITNPQGIAFVISIVLLIARYYIVDKELLSEFSLLCSLSIFCIVITIFYDGGYYARHVFEDTYPRETYVDSPEKLEMTQLKSTGSNSSLYETFLQSSSTSSGQARALVHPPPPNVPESPTAISAYSDPLAIPGPSGLQKSPTHTSLSDSVGD